MVQINLFAGRNIDANVENGCVNMGWGKGRWDEFGDWD